MKNLPIVIFLTVISFAANAQTNVSGGIYANTTWTQANSPYIVTGPIVVFPGFTLTIEPGVEVRINDNVSIELRQAGLIAIGTSADSITFTSNSPTPVPGSWQAIEFDGVNMPSEFRYCNFRYGYVVLSQGNNLVVTHSVFSFNEFCISHTYGLTLDNCNFINNDAHCLSSVYQSTVTNCNFLSNIDGTVIYVGSFYKIANCNFLNNGTALYLSSALSPARISNCIFKYNTIAIMDHLIADAIIDSCDISNNAIGITNGGPWGGYQVNVLNSRIDSNSTGGIYGCRKYSVMNCSISYNGIGVSDSSNSLLCRFEKNIIEHNTVGMRLINPHQITCNKICSNTSDFIWRSSSNINISNNYWCTSDSFTMAARIYDGYDNISLGLVTFMPFNQCYSGGVLMVTISGAILSETGIPIPGVTVTLSGDDIQTATPGTNGLYNFTVAQGGNYTVTPSRNNDVTTNNGITSIDILLTRRHILGTPFSTPYKIMAADVDGSNTVTTLDILLIQSMILQNITAFPNGRLWSFVPSGYVFADQLNPFPFLVNKSYNNLSGSLANQDFIGIKLGDVNNSWDANIP